MKTHVKLAAALFVICGLYGGTNWAHGGGHGGGYWGGYGEHGFGGDYGYYGHSGFGLYFGAPYNYYPYYGGYPYPYAAPPVVTVPASPPVYIQQSPPAAVNQQNPANYWHYCTNPEGYYPYVKECPGGWRLVDPTPPAPH